MPNTEPTEGTPDPPLALPADEAPTPLRQYAGVLRRRWKWIALGVVLGVLAGIASTFVKEAKADPTSYYKATNTLIASGATASSGTGTATGRTANLPQTALLVRSAEVLGGVSTQLGLDPATVSDQVNAVALPEVSAIDVTAIATDPEQARHLADTTAKVLSDFVATSEQSRSTNERNRIVKKLDDLKVQRAQLEAVLASNGGDASTQTQLDSVISEQTATYAQLQGLPEQLGSGVDLSSLQGATPVQINGRAFNARLSANRDALGGASGGVAQSSASGAPAAPANETDLSTPGPVSKKTRILIGAATGLVLGIITAFVVEAWDDRLRRRQRTEVVTGLPVIAEVPILSKAQRRESAAVVVVDSATSRAAESFRAARSSILFLLHRRSVATAGPEHSKGNGAPADVPVILITSPSPSEGKTTTASNIAAAFGDTGVRTLVIDCDYHNPKMGQRLSAVIDPLNLGQPSKTRLPNVWFIPAPPANGRPAEAIAALRQTIERWRPEFEMVVLDTPPMLTTNDAVELLGSSTAVVLVVRSGQTRSGPAARASQLLGRFSSNVLGVILNGCSASEIEDGYGYGYGYGYYQKDETVIRRFDEGPAPTNGNGSAAGRPGTATAPDEPENPTTSNPPRG